MSLCASVPSTPNNKFVRLKGHTLTRRFWCDQRLNSVADLPEGMTYLLGNWVTDRRANAVGRQLGDRRLISSMFDISLPTIAQQSVARGQSDLVVMPLNICLATSFLHLLSHISLYVCCLLRN